MYFNCAPASSNPGYTPAQDYASTLPKTHYRHNTVD